MPPIDLTNEQLMRLKDLPDYLSGKGFGKRVTMRVVNRWVRQGCDGVRLEAVVIDRVGFTSCDAVQRWIDRQSAAKGLSPSPPGSPNPVAKSVAGVQTIEHHASVHLLTEHRVLHTELDRVIQSLDHPASTLAVAAGVLFRDGLRTPEDALRVGLDGLLATKGLGKKSDAVVRSLWRKLTEELAGSDADSVS
jgi:hypothetical protein